MNSEKMTQLVGICCVNIATLAWASNMVVGRLVRDSIGPVTLSASRFVVAAAIFYVLFKRLPPAERNITSDWRLLAAMGVIGVVLFSPTLYWGLHYTTAVNGTIINGLAPLLTGLLAALLIGEPMTRRQLGGAVLALLGVMILVSGGGLSFWHAAQLNKGDIIVLAAVAMWGLYSILASRVMRRRSPVATTALSTFFGLPVLCLLSVWEVQYVPVRYDLDVLLAVVYLGVVPAAGGFFAWNAGVARLGSAGAMVFYNTLPLYGALLGVLLLEEPVGYAHLAGGLLIVAGGLFGAARKRPGAAVIAEDHPDTGVVKQ